MMVLTSRVSKLEQLHEGILQYEVDLGIQHQNRALWSQIEKYKKKFKFGDFVLWFPKGNKSHLGKFIKKWFGLYKVHYMLPNNTVLLVTLTNIEPNPMLENIYKLKPYQFITFEVQNFEVQKPIYQEELHTIDQPWRGVQEDNDMDEDEDDEGAP